MENLDKSVVPECLAGLGPEKAGVLQPLPQPDEAARAGTRDSTSLALLPPLPPRPKPPLPPPVKALWAEARDLPPPQLLQTSALEDLQNQAAWHQGEWEILTGRLWAAERDAGARSAEAAQLRQRQAAMEILLASAESRISTLDAESRALAASLAAAGEREAATAKRAAAAVGEREAAGAERAAAAVAAAAGEREAATAERAAAAVAAVAGEHEAAAVGHSAAAAAAAERATVAAAAATECIEALEGDLVEILADLAAERSAVERLRVRQGELEASLNAAERQGETLKLEAHSLAESLKVCEGQRAVEAENVVRASGRIAELRDENDRLRAEARGHQADISEFEARLQVCFGSSTDCRASCDISGILHLWLSQTLGWQCVCELGSDELNVFL